MLFQRMQWEGDDFLAELGAAPKKKKKAAPAKKAPKPPKAKKVPKPKKAKGPIKKAKAKKAAKKAAKPKPVKKAPAAKKLKALPPAKKQALKKLVKAAKSPAPGAVFAPSPPPESEPSEAPEAAEAPEPESPEESAPEEEATDMDESSPEDDGGDSDDGGGDEDDGGDSEMGALSSALKRLPRLNVGGLGKGQLALRAQKAVSAVCSCSGKKAKKVRGKLEGKMRKRGYPPGTGDKLLASLDTLNAGLARFNTQANTSLSRGRQGNVVNFQAEVLKRLGSTAAKLPKSHPTRKRAKRLIAKHISGILLSAR